MTGYKPTIKFPSNKTAVSIRTPLHGQQSVLAACLYVCLSVCLSVSLFPSAWHHSGFGIQFSGVLYILATCFDNFLSLLHSCLSFLETTLIVRVLKHLLFISTSQTHRQFSVESFRKLWNEARGTWTGLGGEEELRTLCPAPDIVRAIKWRGARLAVYVARKRYTRCTLNIWVGKPDEKSTFGRPRRRWTENEHGPLGTGCEGTYWTELARYGNHLREMLNMAINHLGVQ
jgi:hypothetical protein